MHNMHLEKLRRPLRNMPSPILLILILLSIAMSLTAYSNAQNQRNISPPTEVDGFLPYAVTSSNQGNITISKDNILIEALPATQPRVIVYASTADFEWNFSATCLSASNSTHPIAFSIDWNFGEFLVWSQPSVGWFYNFRPNDTNSDNWNSIGTYLWRNFTVGVQYDIAINWQKLSNSVNLSLLISSVSWDSESLTTTKIPVPPNTNIEYSSLYLESWADANRYSLTRFENSKLSSHNSIKFTQQAPFLNLAVLWGTIGVLVLMALVLIEKISQLVSSSGRSARSYSLESQGSKTKITGFLRRTEASFKKYRIVILLFIIFGVLRVFLAAFTPGHSFDTHTEKAWLNIFQSKGLFAIFPYSDILPPFMGLRPIFPYPPVLAYILAFIPSLPTQTNLASVMIRLPGIAGDLLLGVVVFLALKNRGVFSIAVPALILSLLNLVDSSVWGQYDSIVALFIVLAVWLVASKRIELGWIFMALAVCTKQTSLVVVPALLLLSLKQKSWSRLFYGVLAFVTVFFLIWYPFVQNGTSLDFAIGASGLRLWTPGGGLDPVSPEGGGGTSIWAFNIWPLITTSFNGQTPVAGIIGVKDTLPNQFLFFSYFQAGIILFALAYVILAMRTWKSTSLQDTFLQFGLLLLAFYILPTRVHERYLLFGLSFLPLVYGTSKRIIGSYIILLMTYFLTLGYSLIDGPWRGSAGLFSPIVNSIYSDYGLIILCLINVIVFLSLMISTSSVFARLRKHYLKKQGQG